MMKIVKDRTRIKEALTRSVSLVYPSVELLEKELMSGRRLSMYIGIDPTSQHLHLGHAAGLWTLRRFQDLGHSVTLLIGDFTAQIGDPTDKMAPRQSLKREQVESNMKTFREQASRIISFSGANPAKLEYNSKWYGKMNLEYFINNLLAAFSVQNLFVREDFAKRITGEESGSLQNLLMREDFAKRIIDSKPIRLQEFIYPLLQGWDSRELGVDIEVGGNDQVFNMNIGRLFRAQLRYEPGYREKFFVAVKLLIDTKTGKKLSKTEASLVNLDDEPNEMFGRVMAMPDGMITQVAELSTGIPLREVEKLGKLQNPRDAKIKLAFEIVKTYHSEGSAIKAKSQWEKIFSNRERDVELPTIEIRTHEDVSVTDLPILAGLAKSKSEAWRLVKQGAVSINDKVKKDVKGKESLKTGDLLRVGKKSFFRIKVK